MDDMECEVNAVKDEESVKNEEQDEDNLRGDEATADMVEPDGRGPNRGGGTGIIILEEVSIERVKNSAVVVVSQGCVVLVGPSQERSVGRHGGCEPANDDPKEEIEDKWSMPASVTSVGGSGKKNVRQTPLRSILKKKEHHSRWKTERPSLCYCGDGIQLGGTAFASWEGGLDEIGELDVALRSTAAEQADSVSVVDNSELVDAENNDGTSSAEAGQKGAIRDPTTQEAEVKPPCDSILTVGELYVLETGFEHSVPASIDVTPEPNEYAKELEERLYPLVGIEFKWILKENAEAVEDPSIVGMDKFLDVPVETLQRTREASPAGSSSPEYWKGWYNDTQESSVEAKRADRDFKAATASYVFDFGLPSKEEVTVNNDVLDSSMIEDVVCVNVMLSYKAICMTVSVSAIRMCEAAEYCSQFKLV
ncbi:hypothetical protein PF011_g15700 [Phytophthora fragariae]|uniref:Uncharacterized protein n=1 Tax=Phytophthora fragariae TaxID=53985 RepID=A0A6A3JQ78_9STRA|nr:hypothetical protein PF011_g15700 [Phytophthora fragariae]